MNIEEIVSSNISAEVILFAGNNRACVFGRVSNYGEGGKFIIRPNQDSPNTIIFTKESINKIHYGARHATIYIA